MNETMIYHLVQNVNSSLLDHETMKAGVVPIAENIITGENRPLLQAKHHMCTKNELYVRTFRAL